MSYDLIGDDVLVKLSDLYSTAGSAVTDLSGVVAGADVLASQFVDVKNALQDLQDLVDVLRTGHAYTPTGMVVPFGGASSNVPLGWLPCNGDDWATVGLSSGDPLYDLMQPAGWLGVPDLRGRTVVGLGPHASVDTLGDSDSIAAAYRRPEHKHSVSTTVNNTNPGHSHTVNDSGHTHYVRVGTGNITQGSGSSISVVRPIVGSAYTLDVADGRGALNGGTGISVNGNDLTHGHSASSIVNTGGDVNTPQDIIPYLTLNYIIKK